MEFVQYSTLYMIENIGLMIIDPIFYLLAIAVIYLYKRQVKQFQCTKDDSMHTYHAIRNIIIGIITGLFVSSTLSFYGINIKIENNILLLAPVAMALMMINPKFGCFSYVVAAAYIIEGILESFTVHRIRLDYSLLIALVAGLHIIEGFLVMLCGSTKSIRTIVYKNKTLVVKEILHQIWLLPIVLNLTGYPIPIPVYAILAYNDIANKQEGLKQSLVTGSLIMVFGIILAICTVLNQQGVLPMGIIIILMPVLHEFIFIIGQNTRREAIF